jgi:hypothetical protein
MDGLIYLIVLFGKSFCWLVHTFIEKSTAGISMLSPIGG